jgi:hypothetical protein
MSLITLIPLAICVAGGLLLASGAKLPSRRMEGIPARLGEAPIVPGPAKTPLVLKIFAGVVIIYGLLVLIVHRNALKEYEDLAMLAIGLFISMLAGMFVQVIAANHRADRPIFSVTNSQLTYPVLFSVIVFYPIWASASHSSNIAFSIYASFMNGYFWESVVASARRPDGENAPSGPPAPQNNNPPTRAN